MKVWLFCVGVLFAALLVAPAIGAEDDDLEDLRDGDYSAVSCGSTIKLQNVQTGYRLHSHKVTYGSGSGQQSVTGYPSASDPNSLWLIQGPINKPCRRGSPIKSGQQVRLLHVATQKYLHSHLHASPLSQQQEVSCYDGVDTGDVWEVKTVNDPVWKRDQPVKFKHTDTGKWLETNQHKFQSPIPGQSEVCAVGNDGRSTLWQAQEGFYWSLS